MSRNTAGFTLIEILVVMFIISITLLFVIITPNPRSIGSLRFEDAVNQFSKIVPVAATQAILAPAELGLVVTPLGYGFSEFSVNDENQGVWEPMVDDKILRFRALPKDLRMRLFVNNQDVLPAGTPYSHPLIYFSSSGEITPFEIDFSERGYPPRFRLIGKANGEIELIKIEKTS